MSKPVKELVRKELTRRFEGLTSLAVVGFTGLDANTNNQIRGRLLQKDIRLTVVKNSLARQAFKSLGMEQAAEMLEGPCAVAYGTDPERVSIVAVVRELLDIHKEAPTLTVKAALLEGEIFAGEQQVKRLGSFPTREEAIEQIVQYALSPGANLAGCLIAPGGQLASILESIEKKASDGEQAEAA